VKEEEKEKEERWERYHVSYSSALPPVKDNVLPDSRVQSVPP
jgi:hypothetical protein